MNALRLRFPDRQPADLPLDGGVHPIGRDATGRLALVSRSDALVFVSVDERGAWLQARENARGVHVNGRRVRRMAMLRQGDSIFVDGGELLLLGRDPASVSHPADEEAGGRMVLRGVGGLHHGRCLALDQERVIGTARDADLRLEDDGAGPRRVSLRPHGAGIEVVGDGGAELMVNGYPVRSAVLAAGDQLILDARNRYLLEAPAMCRRIREPSRAEAQAPAGAASEPKPHTLPSSMRRAPWLLLAALLISAALSLLLLYGAR